MEGITESYLQEHGLLTVGQGAAMLGTTLKYMRKLVDTGRIPHVKILNRNLLRRADLERYARESPMLGSRSLLAGVK